jgi:hypothetical protein
MIIFLLLSIPRLDDSGAMAMVAFGCQLHVSSPRLFTHGAHLDRPWFGHIFGDHQFLPGVNRPSLARWVLPACVSKPAPAGIPDPMGVAALASSDRFFSATDPYLWLPVTTVLETKTCLPDLARLPGCKCRPPVLFHVPGMPIGGGQWL